MADKPAKEVTTKRRVKNPESFRERAIKATEESDKPKQGSRVGRVFAAIIGRPLRSIGQAVAKVPIPKPLRTVFRLIGKVIFPAYFRNSWRELKEVTWPSFKESIRLTWAVLLFAIIFGTAVAIVDYGLDGIFKKILLK